MARSKNSIGDADERLGSIPGQARAAALDDDQGGEQDGPSAYGEPLLPIVDDSVVSNAAAKNVAGDTRYARDDSDRAADDREFTEDREISDAERLEHFRLSLFQSSLPQLPPLPGFHCCWLTTTNPRDPVHARIRLGYQLIRASEAPGWDHSTVVAGDYAGCIGVNEMIAAKLPLRLYELYMTEAHHNQPLAEEGKLTAALEAVQAQAGKRTMVHAEEGMAALGVPRRPSFEGISKRPGR